MGHGSAAHLSVLPQGKGITLRMRHAPRAQGQAPIFASIFTVIGHEDASLAASPASHVSSSRASRMATKCSLRTPSAGGGSHYPARSAHSLCLPLSRRQPKSQPTTVAGPHRSAPETIAWRSSVELSPRAAHGADVGHHCHPLRVHHERLQRVASRIRGAGYAVAALYKASALQSLRHHTPEAKHMCKRQAY